MQRQGLVMEYMTYNYFNEMHDIYGSKYETILKMLLLYLESRHGGMLSRFDFLNYRQTICFSGWGRGSFFFQQLKLDF